MEDFDMGEEKKNEPKGTLDVMEDMAMKITKGNRTAAIVVAICMIVLGILFFIWPLISAAGLQFIAAIGILIFGAFQIIRFIREPSGAKQGWTLASGILLVIVGIMALSMGVIDRAFMFSFLLGFLAMMAGINQLTSVGAYKKAGMSTGWLVASGIINLILAAFLLISPLAAIWALQVVFGIYLLVGGIAFLAEMLAIKPAKKA
jgi:uncharacterized membrane protein HdeD (DUF308 family)